VGHYCFCDGAFPTEQSSSSDLCLSEIECAKACQEHTDCTSFSTHPTLPRCTLHTGSCEVDALIDSPLHNFHTVSTGDQWTDDSEAVEDLTVVDDLGYSFDRLLRFKDVDLPAGKFRLCFCDSAIFDCRAAEDFAVDLGEVLVGGMSCLIEDNHYHRGTCIEQYGGSGYRCYPAGQTVDIGSIVLATWQIPETHVPYIDDL